MERMVFAILSLLLIWSSGMAQIRHGGSGWARIDHLEYGHHFSQGATYLSGQVQPFHLPDSTSKTDRGWLNQVGTQVRVGTVDLYFDYSFQLDQSPSKEGQTTTSTLDKGLPSFGWNLESARIQNKFPEFQQAFAPNEAKEQISPIPQVFGVCLDHGDALITTPSPDWQERVDESMWGAVRDIPRSIMAALS